MTTTKTRSQTDLETAILEARSRNDVRALEELQSEYRSSGFSTRVLGPGAISIRERDGGDRSVSTVRSSSSRERAASRLATGRPTVISFAPEATRHLREIDFARGVEFGGFIYGTVGATYRVERLVEATLRDSEGRYEASLDWQEGVDIIGAKLSRVGWQLLGDAHSHVYASTEPSETDRSHWRACATHHAGPWIGLIFCPESAGFEPGYRDVPRVEWRSPPSVAAWICDPGREPVPINVIFEGG